MTVNYEDQIKVHYDKLSNGLKKVAEYLLAQPSQFAVKSAGQVGKDIDVSETTVIRLAYALGYSGYTALQKEVREFLFDMNSSLASYYHGKQEIKNEERFHEQVMNRDREHILRTAGSIDEADFHRAVDKLAGADQILAAGMRSSHALAHWFAFTMDLIKGNTRLFRPETDDVILRVSEMNENSVFVAFSFHRYASETLKLAKALRDKGTFIIGVTDSPVAPIHSHADIVFSIQLPARSTLDAAPVCFSLLNALTSAVSLKDPERFEKRRREYESRHLTSFFNQGESTHDDGKP